ncbi:hypothetical protein KEJ42_01910 [Candidatus Bathyarchaeota archaeon]|nr:hypothetical protein [Candidatus Bathyarchaeota archaeon]
MKQVISLDGVWKLQYFDFGVSVGQFREDYVVVADDNYFDLMPNEERSLSIKVRDVRAEELTLVASAFNAERAALRVKLPS